MQIMLNGKEHNIDENMSIKDLLDSLQIASKAMAIALNSQVVKKQLWESTKLQNSDELEILDFVGGG